MRLFDVLAAAGLFAASLTAHADTLSTYRVNGTYYDLVFTNRVTGTYQQTERDFTGTATFDVDQHFFTYLTVPVIHTALSGPDENYRFNLYPPPFNDLCSGAYFCASFDPDDETFFFNFQIRDESPGDPYDLYPQEDQYGYASLGSEVVTPEPSSFALLGTGLLGAVGSLRRRRV